MIRSDAEYRRALRDLDLVLELLEEERAHWLSEGMTPEEAEAMLEPVRLRAADLGERVELFERVRTGDLSMFSDLEHLGKVLIAARLARGLSQRELADMIGVHESQVSRDERNEYHAVGGERLRALMNALDLRFKGQFRLSSEDGSRRTPTPAGSVPGG
jgi:hypothetical protein